ncbi:hypothetical protein [Streptomyces sp. NBC_01465]|uniref:hypothetical protein n=1 Tax=Streptomyces sp. NBC_01465 TaxID=2903878 RepID=UPI002E3623E2|nr:hypothetical protein [Streptomyces sp. NBC_01465]
MGWTVLYIAFGLVALWLLGEVLLQYKARLRWRLVAFVGFLCVVIGVLLANVLVIALGAVAFALGQTYVTMSFRRGFSTGWAIGGSPGASRRRRGGGETEEQEPTLEVSDLSYEPAPGYATQGFEGSGFDTPGYDTTSFDAPAYGNAMAADSTSVYAPQPMPDDTGQYGIYSEAAYGANAQAQYGSYDTYGGYDQQQGQQGQYDYDATGQQGYAAYSDPYIGSNTGQYDTSYGQQSYADPYYQGSGGGETPPGGVWVPQQRDGEQPFGTAEQQQQDPYYNYGNEQQQYRY